MQVGNYKIIEQIDAGAMGLVYPLDGPPGGQLLALRDGAWGQQSVERRRFQIATGPTRPIAASVLVLVF